MSSGQKFFGKYRGLVTDNNDPLMLGRILAKVPAVFGAKKTGWALPCSPYSGNGVGFFFIPPVGAQIWIEFEAGNPEFPIWSGGFWGTGETPLPANPGVKVLKTDSVTIRFEDSSIMIENTAGLKIAMIRGEIELSDGVSSFKFSSGTKKPPRSSKNLSP